MRDNINDLFGELPQYNDPFKKECIERINFFYCHKNLFGKVIDEFTATVKFSNGDTRGEQDFSASTFPELYQKVIDFCEGL